jgi:hypothetical protein
MSSAIWSIENQRRMSGGSTDPAALRLRMIEGDSDDDLTDDQMLAALEGMDDADRWTALELLPDAVVVRLFGEMDDD